MSLKGVVNKKEGPFTEISKGLNVELKFMSLNGVVNKKEDPFTEKSKGLNVEDGKMMRKNWKCGAGMQQEEGSCSGGQGVIMELYI